MKNIFFYTTRLGPIGLAEEDGFICNLFFGDGKPDGFQLRETAPLKEAASQLEEYLAGRRRAFTLPLAPEGTAFQRSVWDALGTIPFGQTNSYKQVAQKIGNGRAARAVGLANKKNPIPIFIPCHRVIGAGGKLVGYSGGLAIKEQLLMLEKQEPYMCD